MTTPPRPDEPEAERRPARPDEKASRAEAAPAPEKPQGLSYVFKIAPADPKNAFDFEDVADK